MRLITNESVMGERTLTVKKAWELYERWLNDPRITFYPEPARLFEESDSTLVTFDRRLLEFARKRGYAAILPT